MKRAFISLSFSHKDVLAAQLDTIKQTLVSLDIIPLVFVNDYSFAPDQEKLMMSTALEQIRNTDFLIAEVSHKAIGVGLEIGYAVALNKPIIYLRQAQAEPSTTVSGVATHRIVYESLDHLQQQLRDILEQSPCR